MLKVTAGDAPQAVYEARKQEYEIAINQDYDSLIRKPRNPTKSYHPPCAEVEGAVLTARAEQLPHSFVAKTPRHTHRGTPADITHIVSVHRLVEPQTSYSYVETQNNCES